MLYKFHKINNFFFQLLREHSLWLSKPDEFNDPFDSRLAFKVKISDLFQYKKINKKLEPKDPNLERIRKTIRSRIFKVGVSKAINEEVQNIGICCFSKSFKNILLWSHYTDGHKGVCLEFDFTSDLSLKSILNPVVYSNKFPTISDATEVKTSVLTKAICWRYEREIRIIRLTPGPIVFDKTSLKGIIFGSKVEEKEIERIIKLISSLGYNKVNYRKASIDQNEYQMTFSKLT